MPRRRIRSKEHTQRRQVAHRRRLKLYAIAGLFILVLLIGITHWSAIQIKEVTADSSESVSKETVTDLTNSLLSQPLLGVISRENILLLPRAEIRHRLIAMSPRIQSVDINLTGLRSIEVVVTNRQPVAEICSSTAGRVANCFLADETGFLLATADDARATSTELLRYEADANLQLRGRFLTINTFRDLRLFTEALEEIDLYPQQVEVGEHGDTIVTVSNADTPASSNQQSVNLKVSVHEDLSQALRNLQTVIDKESFVAEKSNGEVESISPFELEYIDLRFENKVFYK